GEGGRGGEVRLFAASLAILLTALARPAHAENEAVARELFKAASALGEEGKWADACPKFEESLRAQANVNTQYFLADCYEHLGNIPTAWTNFLGAAAKASAKGEAGKEKAARTRAEKLEPKLPRVSIVVDAETAGLEVKRGEEVVGKGQWGMAIP